MYVMYQCIDTDTYHITQLNDNNMLKQKYLLAKQMLFVNAENFGYAKRFAKVS